MVSWLATADLVRLLTGAVGTLNNRLIVPLFQSVRQRCLGPQQPVIRTNNEARVTPQIGGYLHDVQDARTFNIF
jgi:hypothetical protein